MLDKAIEVLEKLEENGFTAYIVGGFVRDYLIKRETTDIDICTNATPKDIVSIFNVKLLPENNYGSVVVIYKKIRFDITTYRKEIKYEDNRRPVKIKYINNLKKDLCRRDFTINTLCINSKKEVLDILNVRKDLDNKLIKTVGNPRYRIKEDSLRILRAIRFATILDFEIDKKTLKNYCIIGITSIVVLLGFSITMNTQLNKSSNIENYKMPIEHWIMIGLVDNGSYNEDLLNYTLSYNSYSEKREADRLKINEIMRNYTCNDFIKHLTVKLKYAWTDGTYYAPAKLSRNPVNKNVIHECILNDGKYSNVYKYFPQVMHLALLILIIFSCIKLIKEKDYTSYKYILSISMVGIIVFLLIWENRSRYILTMFPIYLALAIDGIDYIGKKITKYRNC